MSLQEHTALAWPQSRSKDLKAGGTNTAGAIQQQNSIVSTSKLVLLHQHNLMPSKQSSSQCLVIFGWLPVEVVQTRLVTLSPLKGNPWNQTSLEMPTPRPTKISDSWSEMRPRHQGSEMRPKSRPNDRDPVQTRSRHTGNQDGTNFITYLKVNFEVNTAQLIYCFNVSQKLMVPTLNCFLK